MSKPFKLSPEEQLELVDDLSWLDITKLDGFEKEVEDILKINPFMDEIRLKTISQQISLRIKKIAKRKKELN